MSALLHTVKDNGFSSAFRVNITELPVDMKESWISELGCSEDVKLRPSRFSDRHLDSYIYTVPEQPEHAANI